MLFRSESRPLGNRQRNTATRAAELLLRITRAVHLPTLLSSLKKSASVAMIGCDHCLKCAALSCSRALASTADCGLRGVSAAFVEAGAAALLAAIALANDCSVAEAGPDAAALCLVSVFVEADAPAGTADAERAAAVAGNGKATHNQSISDVCLPSSNSWK